MLLKICRVKDVKSPSRGHWPDAGIDFYVPNDFPVTNVNPGENILIPSGVKVEIPPGYMGLFLNKSGIASKKEMLIGAQVIDPYYSGEVHIDLHNVSSKEVHIEPGQKIVQMVLVPVSHCQITECDEDMLYEDYIEHSNRGERGFGSTG